MERFKLGMKNFKKLKKQSATSQEETKQRLTMEDLVDAAAKKKSESISQASNRSPNQSPSKNLLSSSNSQNIGKRYFLT